MNGTDIDASKEPGSPTRAFSAPARVNLIGEHTDYTGGYVLPMAIGFSTTASIGAAPRSYRFRSGSFPGERCLEPDDRSPRVGDWSDYPVGVLRELQKLGIEPPPFELMLTGDVPPGSGLSSSASVEVATAMALLAHAGRELPAAEIATLCQRAENDYVGSPCGIMDQFVVTAALAEHALLLNTRDLSSEALPMNTGAMRDYRIVVANSEVRHSIAGGDYGLRRREVEAGQKMLLAAYPALRDLGDATLEQLTGCREAMPYASYLRCRHIISENARVLEARAALLAGDAARMGALMTASHASERDDFQCSVEEIDFLVETALQLKGCVGARLTGGGFGGCTVNLVLASRAESFSEHVRAVYRARYSVDAAIYICQAVDGAVARVAQGQTAFEESAC